jgi:dTDP-glucose 4,6-dehydratase/UDP-glucose 4-epimerase
LLHQIQKNQPNCRFLNFSSAAVYGNPVSLPVKEEMISTPLSPYGFHKILSENICNEFYKLYGVETLSLRVFSAFGPGLCKQLFWDIAIKSNESAVVKLFGTGEESRDFIYIDDLVLAVEKTILHAQFTGGAINVSGGKEITVRYAAETFLQHYKPAAELVFSGVKKTGDPKHWKADISKLNSLGFESHIPFEEGVIRYCDWLRQKEW